MKKTIFWLIIIIFTLSLTLIGVGCKEEAAPAEEVTEEVTEEEAAPAEEEAEEEEEVIEPATVTFWHTYTVETREYETLTGTLIPKFQELNPNITVIEQQCPSEDFHTKLITGVAGGEVPDVARVDIIWVPEFAEMGALAHIDNYDSFNSLASQVFPGPLSSCKWGQNYFGLPLSTNTRVLFWNKEMFDENGIGSPPETLDEFAEAARALTKEGTSWGALYGDTSGWNMLPWIWSGGGNVTDESITTATGYINGENTVNVVQILVDLKLGGNIVDYTTSGVGVQDGYVEKKFAMFLGGPWFYSIIEGAYPDAEINTTLVPEGPGGSSSVIGGEDLVLFEGSQNKDAAYKFIEFMLSEETQLIMAETGQIAVLNSIAESDFIKDHAFYPIYMEQLKTAKARTAHPGWQRMDDAIKLGIEEAMNEVKTVQEALDDVAEQIIAEYE
ncbi:hypothetical protein ES703_84857 [subsurface metagenome]